MVEQIHARATLPLRAQVLRPGYSIEECVFPYDSIPGATHFGYFHNRELVCIATLHAEAREPGLEGSLRLRGMATDPRFQGKGFGQQVVKACIEYAKQEKAREIWCTARTTAAGFYLNLGFINLTPEAYDIPTVGPHFTMHLPLLDY